MHMLLKHIIIYFHNFFNLVTKYKNINQINTSIISILLFSIFVFTYIALNEALAKIGTKYIHSEQSRDPFRI